MKLQFTPKKISMQTEKAKVSQIHYLRKELRPGDEIALLLGLCRSVVFRALRKLGLSRLSSVEPKSAVHRYEWGNLWDMLHVDITRFVKFDGIRHRKSG